MGREISGERRLGVCMADKDMKSRGGRDSKRRRKRSEKRKSLVVHEFAENEDRGKLE